MVDMYDLLLKSKRALSIDEGDCTHDDYLNDLIQSMVSLALKRTGRTYIDDVVVTIEDDVEVMKFEKNYALEDAIVKNVALKFDDLNAKIDYDVFHQFNLNPMI